jgi:MFS family permease
MNGVDLTGGLEVAWSNFITFLPRLLLAVGILVAGYFIAKLFERLLKALLQRVGFDRLVERGGVKRALAQSRYDASDLLSRLVFYAILLFALQFAFGVFGPNPISDLLNRVIGFLPKLFAAVVIVIVASGIAAAIKDVLQAGMAGLSYGRIVANLAAFVIVATGIFAALDQINIAPAIVNGLFYAMLAVVAGSAIVAIGGGGIAPMRTQWEKLLGRIEQEAPRWRERMEHLPDQAKQRAEAWKQETQTSARPEGEQRSFPQ